MRNKLFNKDFLLLWLGQSVSQLGDGAGFIGIMWWVQQETGSALALGTLAMIKSAIVVILGPFAGAAVDRLNRKNIIVITDAMRGLVYAYLAYAAYSHQLTLPLAFLGVAVCTALGQLFGPAISASVPLIVPNEELERASSLRHMTRNIVQIVGYAAGGILVAWFGVPMLLLIDGISYLLSAISEMFINIPSLCAQKVKLNMQLFFTDIKEGIVYVKENEVLFNIMKVAMIINFFSAPFFMLLPKFVDDFMGASSTVYGYILSAYMAGTLIATLVISLTKVVKNNIWLVKWGILLQCFTMGSLIFLPIHVWQFHLIVCLIGGLFNGFVNIYFGAVVQRVTRPEHMGKVFGLMNTIGGGLQPIAQGISGAVADLVGVAAIYGSCAMATGAGGVKFAKVKGIDAFLIGEETSEKRPETEPIPAS